jgi:hypothetical protein
MQTERADQEATKRRPPPDPAAADIATPHGAGRQRIERMALLKELGSHAKPQSREEKSQEFGVDRLTICCKT